MTRRPLVDRAVLIRCPRCRGDASQLVGRAEKCLSCGHVFNKAQAQ